MAINWAGEYLLNDGPENVVVPNAILELELKMEGSKVTYMVKGTPPTPAWKDCWLVPRGSKAFEWNEAKLDKWAANQKLNYDKLIKKALKEATADTERLEGEITVENKKELVMLFIGPEAVLLPDGTKQDIVIIRSVDENLIDLKLLQDGTGHGNPR